MVAERTCVVCRKTGSKSSLLRFVLNRPCQPSDTSVYSSGPHGGDFVCRCEKDDVENLPGADVQFDDASGLIIDLAYRLSGRGAYCHEEAACLLSKQVLGKLCYSLEVGSAKRKKFRSEKLTVNFSLKDLLEEAKKRYGVADRNDKKSSIAQKLNALERWVEQEYDRVKDLRHKRRVRL